MVNEKVIEADPSKLKAILEMPPPKRRRKSEDSLEHCSILAGSSASWLLSMNPSSKSSGRIQLRFGTKLVRRPLTESSNILPDLWYSCRRSLVFP